MEDRYLSTSESRKRLYTEYLKYGKLIVAFDFDNTVYDFHKVGDTFPKIFELLKKCNELGFYLIVFTASTEERIPYIKDYLENNGIKYDAINENAPFTQFTGGKIYYNILLDDRSGLREAYDILKSVIDQIENVASFLNGESNAS